MSSEDDSLVVNDESAPLVRGSRVDASFPNGYFASGDERVRTKDGNIRTASGHEYSIFMKANVEFFGGLFFWFFGKLATIMSTNIGISLKNTAVTGIGRYAVDNSTGLITNTTEYTETHGSYAFLNQATGLVVRTSDQTFISNPLATFVTALSWGGLLFLTLRALPGISLNPWVSLNNFFFAWKREGKLGLTHIAHLFQETFWCVFAQLASAIVACIFIYLVMDEDTSLIGETLPSPSLSAEWKIIPYEAIASFLFMTLINIYSRPRRDVSANEQALFLGASLFFIVMGFSGFTGASINFANTLGPAVVRSMFSGVHMRLSVLYYLIGQGAGFFGAGLISWFINSAAHMRLFRTITSSTKED